MKMGVGMVTMSAMRYIFLSSEIVGICLQDFTVFIADFVSMLF